MKKLQSFICILALLSFGLTSCEKENLTTTLQTTGTNEITLSHPSTDLLVPDGNAPILVDAIGMIISKDGEYLINSQGKTYLPDELPEDFHAQKLQVFFVGKVSVNSLENEIIPIELLKISATDRPIDLPNISSPVIAIDRTIQ